MILFLVIAIDFCAAIKIEGAQSAKSRKLYLSLSLLANLSILGFFKYSNFFIENWNDLATLLGFQNAVPLLRIVLPIGLSFHTFQSMAYIFEVYYGRFKAERDWLVYSIYVLYFPQLVAGPIERPQNLIHQFKEKKSFDEHRVVSGLYLIAQGLFKKVVLADTLAPVANRVFDHSSQFGVCATLLGILAFTIQIYGDFSGYSDIARGSSRILGVELMVNFRKPYLATSVSDFWRRWHVSLSTWFRDYLYIPLGGNQLGFFRTQMNLMIVFLVSGLWHGANWTFLVWGALHGIYLLVENLLIKKERMERWGSVLSRSYVFILVAFAWIFFRAAKVREGVNVIAGLVREPFLGLEQFQSFQIQESLLFILLLFGFEALDEKVPFWAWLSQRNGALRWSIYFGMVMAFLFCAQIGGAQFIYFQF